MSFIKWFFNNEILTKLTEVNNNMSQIQEKIDLLTTQLAKSKNEILAQIAALQEQIDNNEPIDLSELTAAVQGIDDINPDPEIN